MSGHVLFPSSLPSRSCPPCALAPIHRVHAHARACKLTDTWRLTGGVSEASPLWRRHGQRR
eukprot:89588-Rhodomonas_salina.1